MSNKRMKLSAEEASVILRSNEKNVDAITKRLLQKVVDKKTLSEEEIGELEGIVANETLRKTHQAMALAPDADTPDAIVTRTNFKKMERDVSVQARRRIIVELRTQQPPVPIRQIAERLNIATDTVCKDIAAIREQNREILDGSKTLEILGQTCTQFDILYGKAMTLMEQYSGPMAKAAFLRTAISALDSKAKLMGETGIIHRVPERLEVDVNDQRAGNVRDKVARLVHAMDQRTSSTIELPPPKAIEPPAEVADEAVQEDGSDPFGA